MKFKRKRRGRRKERGGVLQGSLGSVPLKAVHGHPHFLDFPVIKLQSWTVSTLSELHI